MADQITRIYGSFRGVDFRGDEINLIRSPDALNVWKDYRNTERIETRPGLMLSKPFTDSVYGIFFYNDTMLIHSGNKLYKAVGDSAEVLYTGLNEAKSGSFIYDNVFYLKDGLHYLKYDGNTVSDVVGYIPTTTIARKPMGGGTTYEDVNMLSPYRKNSFLADGMSYVFALDVINIDADYTPIVTVNGVEVNVHSFDPENGTVDLGAGKAPDAPLTDGQDNVVIQFKKTVPKYTECIEKCTMLQVFDNRVFFSGNPEFPNMVWNSSLNDPSYVSDLDYYKEGMDSAAVKGLVAGNNALWVFREPSDANTTVFYHTPSLDDEYGKVYPSTHSSITIGCIGSAVNFNDDIVFFSERGMEGISGDVTTEQAVAHRSSLVDRKMIAEAGYKDMVLAEWKGYLLVFIGNSVYLADSRSMFQNENHLEYEFYYWELDRGITCATVKDGILYLGAADGVYTLNDYKADIVSYWTTPLDKFKNPNKMKTTNKKGSTVEATGSEISVYVKTNKDEDFELIETFYDITDAFNFRMKKKKWKDIQLKFHSTKRFSLETVVMESFVGGYLKHLDK